MARKIDRFTIYEALATKRSTLKHIVKTHPFPIAQVPVILKREYNLSLSQQSIRRYEAEGYVESLRNVNTAKRIGRRYFSRVGINRIFLAHMLFNLGVSKRTVDKVMKGKLGSIREVKAKLESLIPNVKKVYELIIAIEKVITDREVGDWGEKK